MSRQKDKERCPLCDKHCPLKSPHCRKGEKYARSLQKEDPPQPEPSIAPVLLSIDDTLLMQLQLISRNPLLQTQDGSSRYRILSLLAEHERIGQQEIKGLLGIKSGSLSELLAKLEKKGLIRRKKNDADKRNRDIVMTEEGRHWLRDHAPEDPDASQLFSVLSEDEKMQLSTLLGRLLASEVQNPPANTEVDTQPVFEVERDVKPEADASVTEEEAPLTDEPTVDESSSENESVLEAGNPPAGL